MVILKAYQQLYQWKDLVKSSQFIFKIRVLLFTRPALIYGDLNARNQPNAYKMGADLNARNQTL